MSAETYFCLKYNRPVRTTAAPCRITRQLHESDGPGQAGSLLDAVVVAVVVGDAPWTLGPVGACSCPPS